MIFLMKKKAPAKYESFLISFQLQKNAMREGIKLQSPHFKRSQCYTENEEGGRDVLATKCDNLDLYLLIV